MAKFTLNNTFWAATDVKHLTFQGNAVDELTINGNTVLLPLDYTATIPAGNQLTNQSILFPTTKSKLARGLLLSYHVRKTSSTGKATFALTYIDGSEYSYYYQRVIHTIDMTASSPNDKSYSIWYNGNVCMLGEGPTLQNWTSAAEGGTYISLSIKDVSNLYLVEPMTIRVVSDWESREEEDTSTTTTTTATTAAAAADAYGFTLIDE